MFSTDPEYTFFHTRIWLDTLLRVFNHWRDASRRIALPDGRYVWLPMIETDRIGLWRWLESMPLAFFGGPLVNEGQLSRDDFAYVLSQIKPGAGFVNFNLDPLNPLARQVPSGVHSITTHLLNLERGFEAAQGGFSKMVQRHIRRAEGEGVNVRCGQSAEDFGRYFALTKLAAQRWGLSAPPFSAPLYEALAQLPDEQVRLWLAEYKGQTIGGLISVHYTLARAMYWGSAFDPDYAHLSPTKLLQREAVRAACEKGIQVYNMGPSVGFDGTPLAGVRETKEAFGAQPYDYAVAILMNPWAMRTRAVRDRLRRRSFFSFLSFP